MPVLKTATIKYHTQCIHLWQISFSQYIYFKKDLFFLFGQKAFSSMNILH